MAIYSDCNTLLYQEYLPVQASSVNGKCKLRFIATANTTYYAKFTLTALNNFSFSLNELEVQDGYLCTKPIYVTVNTLTLPADKPGQIVWCSYTSTSVFWLNHPIGELYWAQTTSFVTHDSCSHYALLSYLNVDF